MSPRHLSTETLVLLTGESLHILTDVGRYTQSAYNSFTTLTCGISTHAEALCVRKSWRSSDIKQKESERERESRATWDKEKARHKVKTSQDGEQSGEADTQYAVYRQIHLTGNIKYHNIHITIFTFILTMWPYIGDNCNLPSQITTNQSAKISMTMRLKCVFKLPAQCSTPDTKTEECDAWIKTSESQHTSVFVAVDVLIIDGYWFPQLGKQQADQKSSKLE